MPAGPAVLALFDWATSISVPSPGDLVWLGEMLGPPFAGSASDPATSEIALRIDAGAFAALYAQGPAPNGEDAPGATLCGQQPGCRRWGDAEASLHDEELRVFYRGIGWGGAMEVLAAAEHPRNRVALLRLVRELATGHLAGSGWVQIHGAGLEHAGRGLLICGPKRAGKTSLAMHALADSGTRFLSNDRCLIGGPGGAGPGLVGIPTVVSVRPGSAALFPRIPWASAQHWRARLTLAEALALPAPTGAAVPAALSLSTAQYCHLLGVRQGPPVPLNALVFPRVDPDADGLSLRRLDPEETLRHLADNLIAPALPAGAETPPVRPGTLKPVAEGCPGFACTLGAGAYHAPFPIRVVLAEARA